MTVFLEPISIISSCPATTFRLPSSKKISLGSTPYSTAKRDTGFMKPEKTPASPPTTLRDFIEGISSINWLSAISAESKILYRSMPVSYPIRSNTATRTSSWAFPAPAPKARAVPSRMLAPSSAAAIEFAIPIPRLLCP